MSIDHDVWRQQRRSAVFVGRYQDSAGVEALFFLDPEGGDTLGPLVLSLAKIDPAWECPAPSVGKPGPLQMGARYAVEYHYVGSSLDSAGRDIGVLRAPGLVAARRDESWRGTFVAARPDSGHTDILSAQKLFALANDPLAKGLVVGTLQGDEATAAVAELDRLGSADEVRRALEGFRISGNKAEARRFFERKIKSTPLLTIPDLADFRYSLPLAIDGLKGLVEAGECVPSDHLRCSWLATLVAPARCWEQGKKGEAEAAFKEGFVRGHISGFALFDEYRNQESTLQPTNAPFMVDGGYELEILKAASPSFFKAFRSAIEKRYSIPRCEFESFSEHDGRTWITVGFDRISCEYEWKAGEKPAFRPKAAIGVLVEKKSGVESVIHYRIR
ncbi:MAG TPA: hypothetical protein VKU80_18110 [Planctomycetota bacterium]|nr:hypothetical protein [Planctomycetota bacterium]